MNSRASSSWQGDKEIKLSYRKEKLVTQHRSLAPFRINIQGPSPRKHLRGRDGFKLCTEQNLISLQIHFIRDKSTLRKSKFFLVWHDKMSTLKRWWLTRRFKRKAKFISYCNMITTFIKTARRWWNKETLRFAKLFLAAFGERWKKVPLATFARPQKFILCGKCFKRIKKFEFSQKKLFLITKHKTKVKVIWKWRLF